ncbi:uncharacterized protein DUF4345 [Enterovirga rhinocerotis]|uniref:Uncharacterized protein DUF4345 n=2 Tax=Enterovirga rhinocerotis TaxID=1339210 RepID=A0A4R7CAT3_9HYPH|nr:uncharacterized protein DUF4345 [Enterovirga rhinocerotis]
MVDGPAEEDPRVLAKLERRRRLLQQAIGAAALIPVAAGLYGVLFGPALTGERLGTSGDSHYRYLSGLHLAVGLLCWSTIPSIESTGPRFRLLTLMVFIGGLARFFGMTLAGLPSFYMLGALTMELVVMPILCFWQWRIARGYAVEEKRPVIRRENQAPPPPVATAPVDGRVPAPRPQTVPDDLPEPVPAAASGDGTAMAAPPPPAPNPRVPETARSST